MVWFGNRAAGPTVIDSFERASLDHYVGSPGSYEINTNFATDGSNGLALTNTATAVIISTSGLDNYPSKPAEFRYDVQTSLSSSTSETVEASPVFAAADDSNYYFVQIRADFPEVRIWRVDGGAFDVIDTGGDTLSEWNADTTYTVIVQWDDGSTFGGSDNDITVTVENPSGAEIGSESANDATHAANDGVGMRANKPAASETVNSDFWRITG